MQQFSPLLKDSLFYLVKMVVFHNFSHFES